MEKLIDRITNQIESMNSISRKVIKYGFFSFLFIIMSCFAVLIINKYSLGNIYSISKASSEVFKSSFSVLGITIIGGIIMDFLSKRITE